MVSLSSIPCSEFLRDFSLLDRGMFVLLGLVSRSVPLLILTSEAVESNFSIKVKKF